MVVFCAYALFFLLQPAPHLKGVSTDGACGFIATFWPNPRRWQKKHAPDLDTSNIHISRD